MKISKWVVAMQFVAVTATFGTVANAAMQKGACAEDIKKLCADAKPGAGGTAACLKQHDAELSAACKAHQDDMNKKAAAKAEAFNAACGEDMKKHCPDAKPGKGLTACLHGKEAELSQACKDMLPKKKPMAGHGPGPGAAAKP